MLTRSHSSAVLDLLADGCHRDHGAGQDRARNPAQLAEASRQGIPWSRSSRPSHRPAEDHMDDFGDICGVLNLLPQAGGIAALHDEDNDIVMHMYEKQFREDRTDFGRPRPRRLALPHDAARQDGRRGRHLHRRP
jgi:hypothetical protein